VKINFRIFLVGAISSEEDKMAVMGWMEGRYGGDEA